MTMPSPIYLEDGTSIYNRDTAYQYLVTHLGSKTRADDFIAYLDVWFEDEAELEQLREYRAEAEQTFSNLKRRAREIQNILKNA